LKCRGQRDVGRLIAILRGEEPWLCFVRLMHASLAKAQVYPRPPGAANRVSSK
jgi:hypothetical protein